MEYEKLNKKFGKDLIKPATEVNKYVEWSSTGIEPLDFSIGKGIPKGRMVSIKGLPSATKTSLALTAVAQAQKEGLQTIFVDAEWALSLEHAEKLGVDLEKMLVISPETAEEAIEAIEELATEETLVVVDSVAALSAKAEAEAGIEGHGMAQQARVLTRALRRLTPIIAKSNSIIIWINQLRMNFMGGQYNPYKETGGEALKYYTSVGLEVKRKQSIKQGDAVKGYSIDIKVTKNKVGAPDKVCTLDYFFDTGFHGESNYFDVAVERDIIVREGNSYYLDGEKLGTGQKKAKEALTEEIVEKIKSRI